MNASVRPSGEKRGCRSCLAPRVNWSWRSRPVGRDQPQRAAVAVEAGGDGLDRDDRQRCHRATGVARSRCAGGRGRRGGGRAARRSSTESGRGQSSGLPSGHDGRPALAAPRGRPAARSAGPAADAPAPTAGAVRFRRAPVRAVVGRRTRARVDRAGRLGRGRGGRGSRCRRPRPVGACCPSWPGWPSGSPRARRSSTASWSWSMPRAGRTRSSWRAGWRASPGRPAAFLAFDLLHLDGRSLLSQPLVRRREALRRVLRPGDEVVAVPAIATEGIALFEAAVAQGIAGHPGPTAHEPVPARGAQPAVAVRGGHARGQWPGRDASRSAATCRGRRPRRSSR